MMNLSSKRHVRWISGVMLTLTAFTLAGCGSQKSSASRSSSSSMDTQRMQDDGHTSTSNHGTSVSPRNISTKVASNSDDKQLASWNYRSGQDSVVKINDGHSTLNPKSWRSNYVKYANLDNLNRTSAGNIGYLEGRNIANSSLRTSQTFKPTGYKQKFINNQPILNRGHEIAYSLSGGISTSGKYEPKLRSGDQNNPKNLFSQTAFSNQKVQTIYESQVRNALKQGKKVIYQVQPVFHGKDRMAKGVHMQAVSTDGSLNYNVYLYNVQPGMKFNYATGSSQVDRSMNVPTPAGAPTFHDSTSRSTTRNEYHGRTKKHHYVRDAAIAGAAHHVIKRHYQKKYGVAKHHHTIRNAVIGGFAVHEAHKHFVK